MYLVLANCKEGCVFNPQNDNIFIFQHNVNYIIFACH